MTSVLGKSVGPIGYGLMGLSWRPNPAPLEQTLETLRAAVQNGCTLWNGGSFYGTPEYNSMTIIKAYFTKYPEDADKVTIFIKGGQDQTLVPNGSPEFIRESLDSILAQLGGVKKLDAFACSRRDPRVPFETTLDVIQKEYIDTGKIGGVYISECGPDTIHLAAKHAKVLAAEVELSMFTPDILKNGVAAAAAEHGIPILAYSPIGRGMLTGRFTSASDFQGMGIAQYFPRFQEGAVEHNLKLVAQVQAIAEKKGCTPAQLAIGWVKGQQNRNGLGTIIPIPGATTVERLTENSKLIVLDEDELKAIDDIVNAFEVSGTRYPAGAPTNT